MAEFKITRFRYTWKGDWTTSTTYNKDDVVYYSGSAYVCIRQHTSTSFNYEQTYLPAGETLVSPGWVKSVDGKEFTGDWVASTAYFPGDLVLLGGNVYLAVTGHTSQSDFNDDIVYWEVYAVGSNWRNTWNQNTIYQVGDIVRYNGYTYQCVLGHTSGTINDGIGVGNNDDSTDSTFETWTVVVENYTYVGSYQTNTRYRQNDLVKYGGSILRCTVEHTSSGVQGQIVDANFATYLPGFNYSNQWSGSVYYAVGDVISYGGIIYIAVANNYASIPGFDEGGNPTNPAWNIVTEGINFRGDYDPQSNISYKRGDVVRRGGSLWVSLVNHSDYSDSALLPIDSGNWKLVIQSSKFTGSWHTNEVYNLYDLVYYRGAIYYANIPHISSFENFPGDNGSGYFYWNQVVVSTEDAALSQLGDMLTRNFYREILQDGSTQFSLGDTSTVGHTSIPIGETDELLMVSNNTGDIGYETWGTLQRVVWVRTDGVDDDTDPNRGFNYFKPWRTLKFALEQVDDGYEGTTSIKLGTGEYQEILPLIVPARTAVVGEELRSTTVRASEPIPTLASDAPYTIATLIHLGSLIGDIILGNTVTPTPGNDEYQTTVAPATSVEANIVNSLWANIISMIDYRVNDIGTEPTVTGSNTQTTDGNRLSARVILESNREFIKSEAIAYMAINNPEYSFDTEKCRRDIDKYIDAVRYDLLYSGNYKSVLAGRYYANAVTGSALEDMFYVRDTTGIRNMTLKGLNGTLPAIEEGEFYTIPTGGAFVSLDPGWGPNDDRVWILNRSCYIQNVTTFGFGAIGQKIDGLLHNGGNRSIVSNDFTQVISDGIGAWVSDGGRAELVSVFTYYAHIGMFAKDGGIIRATNGNSSYGDFGALADGIDPAETVRYGNINTRSEQAQVAAAFAGEILDFILALEFVNCGQNYTTASYTITSSGVGATAKQEEFRDNSMFTVQILDAGAGYAQYGNQAQTGNTTQITLATAETVVSADILGMRIIIISGEGTGQYGYVQAYNSTTKVCTVYKESTDTIGWDHVLPGTPSSALLTAGTRYRIEPRVTFTHPGFTAQEITLPATDIWAGIVYGETSQTFTGVEATLGTGAVIEVIPASAEFTVVKTGRSYTITITNGGAGYAVGDTLVIDGANVGGVSIEHDITLTVLTVSNDSTNSILTFATADDTLIANSGRFILTPINDDLGFYSNDGENWTEFDLPSIGNWKNLAAGNNRFVAVRYNSDQAAYSTNGISWTASSMPASRNWNGVVFGKPTGVSNGIFVAVAGNLNSAAYSTNGVTWTASTLPTFGDSTLNEYVDIAFGGDKFVAIANSGNIAAVGTWNGTTLTWQGTIMDVINDSSQKDWISVTYGNRRFVAISSTGDAGYSFNGSDWYPAAMPTQDGSTAHVWRKIAYGQGVFIAIGDTGSATVGGDPTTGPTTYAVTSYDGIIWNSQTLANSEEWGYVAFGNPDITLGDSSLTNSKPMFIAVPRTATNIVNRIYTGARALGRAVVGGGGISYIKIWEPGSGYSSDPTMTLTNPGVTENVSYRVRTADGVLAQPKFLTQGSAYKTSTTFVTVAGDGFADKTPVGKFITLDNLTVLPGPGAQFYIAGRTDYFVAVVVGINEEILPDNSIRSTFQISPQVDYEDYLEHGMEVLIREKYSQVRITGHDFLDVGTGNEIETNYPELYQNYEFTTEPFQEVYNLNGGRVFYTSTDQDGNFRAGEQFAVEQATGVITISADFFDLSGLTELRLAGINVGSTAVIREFSKDPLFLQNSNAIIPTQRAIVSYLQSRLNVGGEDLLTPSFIAGTVLVGPNLINSTAGLTIDVPVVAEFAGSGAGISGHYIATIMMLRELQ
jgi:hypothetical protein